MDTAFYTNGISAYNEALQNYSNKLNEDAVSEEKLQKALDAPIDDFNQKLSEITEPLGTSILHEPVGRLIKAGANKFLDKQVKPRLKKFLGQTGDQGPTPDAPTPPDGTQVRPTIEPIDDGEARAISSATGRSIRNTQTTVNPVFDERPGPVLEDGEEQFRDSTFNPSGEARQTVLTQADLSDRYDRLPPELQRNVDTRLQLEGADPELSVPQLQIADQAISDQERSLRSGEIPQEISTQTAPPAPTEPAQAATPAVSDANGAAATRTAGTAPEDHINTTTDEQVAARQAPKPRAPGRALADGTTDVESGLATAAEDAEIAGGGPEDPFSDIVAGILGIGSVLAGAFGQKEEPRASLGSAEYIPSTQFGI
jgi:hypothetical protein